jgi:rsbT co-antagonist protein RsbR
MAERNKGDRASATRIPELVAEHEKHLLSEWVNFQLAAVTRRADLMNENELREQSRRFLGLFRAGLQSQENAHDIDGSSWSEARELLSDISRSRAAQGFTPRETATFVFSLKEPLFDLFRSAIRTTPQDSHARIGP